MKFPNVIILLIIIVNNAIAENKITKSYEVTVNNHLERDYKDMPVAIKIKDFNADFRVRSAIVYLYGT